MCFSSNCFVIANVTWIRPMMRVAKFPRAKHQQYSKKIKFDLICPIQYGIDFVTSDKKLTKVHQNCFANSFGDISSHPNCSENNEDNDGVVLKMQNLLTTTLLTKMQNLFLTILQISTVTLMKIRGKVKTSVSPEELSES